MPNKHKVLFALAFAYFGCYVPYSAITKALTSAHIAGDATVTGLTLLPVMTIASTLAMVATITALGWWRYARGVDGKGWPRPNRWTLLSGLATTMILVTTTLAYTFDGVSLAFVMLVMRGGVLVIAPVIDLMTGRRIRWFSWVALGLSLVSLANTLLTRVGDVPLLCALDLGCYLLGYVIRLRLMAKLGKSEDPSVRRRYFVEEQMVAAPAAVVVLVVLAVVGPPSIHAPLRHGFFDLWHHSTAWWATAAGIFSQGTGVFGGLMLLDASEATYCVPLNRAMSILGGVVAASVLAFWFGIKAPSVGELIGAGLLVSAIVMLWLGPVISQRRALRTP